MTMRFVMTAGALAALLCACAAAAQTPASQTPASQTPPAKAAPAKAAPARPGPAKLVSRTPALAKDEAPGAAPLAPPPANEPTTTYIVKKGDTLWGLGDKYFIRRPTYEEVRVKNGVKFVRRMAIGLQLIIPTRLLRTEPIDAHLGAFRGAVTITGGGVTGAPALNMVVREGAVVATAADGFARLDLPDGSRVAVPSQSRVRIDIMHRVLLTGTIERTFAIEAGRTESSVAPVTGPQDNYFVRTPISVSAVRGTDFRVEYTPGDSAASTGVVEGSVAVDAPQAGSALVPAKFGVGIKPGAPLNVVPLLPAPGVQNAGRLQDAPDVTFDVDPVEGAKAYRMQLASDAGMQEIFAEQTSPDGHFTFKGLANGDYFLRATALDPSNIEGLPRVYAFERDLNTIAPTSLTPSGAKGARQFLFKWEAQGDGVRTYRFQVAKEPSAEAPFIDEGGLKDPQITITNLPPGEYHWRVMSTTVYKGRYVEKWTAPQKFTVPAN